MQISVELKNIQHVKHMLFSLDLTENRLTCLVGKNGVGKTTLIKSILNLCSADTFSKTISPGVFKNDSEVIYNHDNETFVFDYDASMSTLNCKSAIPEKLKDSIDVELPIPFGRRFDHYQKISSADKDIRTAIILGQHTKPMELIDFLNDIYSSKKFETLVEINIKNTNYYCIPLDGDRYVREDHLSSGEFFLISLYRKITNHRKLIVIDEIDISLDAAAQAHLVRRLRNFCETYQVNILCTTHSLAIMRTLRDNELYYMANTDGAGNIIPASYNYIKSIMFGFIGWDKYILTEDEMLKNFLEFIIDRYCPNNFSRWKIIPIGGGANVTTLARLNHAEKFLSIPENVISILDGDQRIFKYNISCPNTYFLPFESVEKKIYSDYKKSKFLPNFIHTETPNSKKPDKIFYSEIIEKEAITNVEIFEYLCKDDEEGAINLSKTISSFLSQKNN
ncbi:ATP-binding protein [Pseudomonas monsensis]|uniref:ATP-dependent nuclease n=1 Tax=Pseudomonas monsensis TaxID=2745509 RepID=UPI00164407A8|nr:AAA family ATPase [Pseudomonas monsensis]QXI02589.1 ATP-binding protein [Pseudomonas monsensis]